jgi:hypothetical protein
MKKKPYRHPLPLIRPPKASTYEIVMRFVMVAFLVLFWIAFYFLAKKALG